MIANYRYSERVDFGETTTAAYRVAVAVWSVVRVAYRLGVAAWPVVRWLGTVAFTVAVAVVWAAYLCVEAAVRFVYANRTALLYAGKVLAITTGWLALLVGAVVLSVLYWHIVVAMGIGALAMWVTYPRTAVRP